MVKMVKDRLKPKDAGERYIRENPNRVYCWITGEIKE
jgi:ABC-type proline/glycine betaine transport system substrate-binding protein